MGSGLHWPRPADEGASGHIVQGFALYFLAFFGVPSLAKFGTLGTVKMEMVFDVATMKNVVNDYDNSFEILLMSMISFIVIAALIAAAMMVVSSNYQLQKIREAGKKTNNFVQDINVYLNEKFYVTLLTLPVLGVVVFTIVPLFILIAVAFTPTMTSSTCRPMNCLPGLG